MEPGLFAILKCHISHKSLKLLTVNLIAAAELSLTTTKKPFRLLNFPKDRSIFERLQCDLSISMAEGIAMIHRGGQLLGDLAPWMFDEP